MKTYLLFLISLPVLVISCVKEESENVNQDSIYTIYELFYNQNQDKTTAQATFRFGGPGGTLLNLSDPAVSTFNNDELNYNQLLGVHNREYTGLTTSGTFRYTDLDNNQFTNATATIIPIDFPTVDTIDAANAFSFQWSGSAIAAGETVSLTIDGTQQNNFEIFSSSSIGATQLVLPANRLQKLGAGNATCTFIRAHNRADVDEGTSKGGRMAVWYTVTRTIHIRQ